jgi:hypothetical protein
VGKRIGYAKLGRSMPLTLAKCGNLGGDVEGIGLLMDLARRHPDDTFIIVGRNSGEHASRVGFPLNVINIWCPCCSGIGVALKERILAAGIKGLPLTSERQLILAKIFDDLTLNVFTTLDGMVMWIGQHGTSNTPIPMVNDPTTLTKPQDWCAWYAGFLLRGINAWRDQDPWHNEEVNLNADPRNRHKMRDLKWPLRHPVLAQHNGQKALKHHRYGDPEYFHTWDRTAADERFHVVRRDNEDTWVSTVYDVYARLEVNGLMPGTPFGDLISFDGEWGGRMNFGLFINETRKDVRAGTRRIDVVRDWVLPLDPWFIHGTWSQASLDELSITIRPAPWGEYFTKLHSVLCTLTTPASGTGWATAKPWEAFAAGTVCFFHPLYDTQDNILADAPSALKDWLRVRSPEELAVRVAHLSTRAGRGDWTWLVDAQRAHFDRAVAEARHLTMIEERIWK